MRVLVWLLVLSAPVLASPVAEVRLVFYTGAEYFEPRPEECSVELLRSGQDVGLELDYAKQTFKAPYGRYTLVVKAPGFRNYRREVLISQSVVDLLVGLQLGDIGNHAQPPPPTVIEGRVSGKNLDYSTLWLRAAPVFGGGNAVFDTRLDENGRFTITPYNAIDPESRKYIILVLAPKPSEEQWTDLVVVSTKEVDVRNHKTTQVEIIIE